MLATARLQAPATRPTLGLLIELSRDHRGGRRRHPADRRPGPGRSARSPARCSCSSSRATLIKHNLPDSVAQMVQAVIIIAAVYAAREQAGR